MFIWVILTVDMFLPTDVAKNAVDIFPRTDDSKDISPVLSSHIETVVLMSRAKE